MKKISILFLMLMAKFSLAEAGAYVSIGIGGNILSGKQILSAWSNNGGPASFKYGSRGAAVSAEISAGYGWSWNSVYFGAEGNGYFTQVKSRSTLTMGNQNRYFSTKVGSGYGIALRCGYHVASHALTYIRLGLESRQITVHFQDLAHDPDDRYPMLRKDYRGHAFAPGIGMEQKLNDKFALRLEGRAAFYRQRSFNNIQSNTDYTKIKTKPRLYSLTTAITYTF